MSVKDKVDKSLAMMASKAIKMEVSKEDVVWIRSLEKNPIRAIPEVIKKLVEIRKTDEDRYNLMLNKTAKHVAIFKNDLDKLIKDPSTEKTAIILESAFAHLPGVLLDKAILDGSISSKKNALDFSTKSAGIGKLSKFFVEMLGAVQSTGYDIASVKLKNVEDVNRDLGETSQVSDAQKRDPYVQLLAGIISVMCDSKVFSIKNNSYISVSKNSCIKVPFIEARLDKSFKSMKIPQKSVDQYIGR